MSKSYTYFTLLALTLTFGISSVFAGSIQLNTNLQRGSRGSQVRALQSILNRCDETRVGRITGTYGGTTTAKVRKFQELSDLAVTGKVDTETRLALNEGNYCEDEVDVVSVVQVSVKNDTANTLARSSTTSVVSLLPSDIFDTSVNFPEGAEVTFSGFLYRSDLSEFIPNTDLISLNVRKDADGTGTALSLKFSSQLKSQIFANFVPSIDWWVPINVTGQVRYLSFRGIGNVPIIVRSVEVSSASLSAQVCPVGMIGIFPNCYRSSSDTTSRIAFWPGKVNQHVDIATGEWKVDPDGVSGGNPSFYSSDDFGGRELDYCKKWYPNTTRTESYKDETIYSWRNRGNLGEPFTNTVKSVRCVDNASPTIFVGRSAGFPSANVAPNTANLKIGSFTVQNNSNTDIRLTNALIGLGDSTASMSGISNMKVLVSGTQQGATFAQPSYTNNNFSLNYILSSNSATFIDVYADIASELGKYTSDLIVAGSANTSGNSIIQNGDGVRAIGQTVTVVGSANPVIQFMSAVSPLSRIVPQGSTSEIATYKITSVGAPIVVTDIDFSISPNEAISSVSVLGRTVPVIGNIARVSGVGLEIPPYASGYTFPVVVTYGNVANQRSYITSLKLTGIKYRFGNSITGLMNLNLESNKMRIASGIIREEMDMEKAIMIP